MALATGMRHGELAAVRWEDLNFEEGSVYVHRNVGYLWKLKHVEGEPKTEAGERTIPLAPHLCVILKAHSVRQNEERLKAGARWQDRDLVFCNRSGGFLTPPPLRASFYRLLEQAGLPRIHIHDLRHAAATLFRSMGVDIKVVQEILGHSTLDMTANVYSHVLPHMQKEASEKINRLFQ
jgi:integrase